MNAQKLPLSGQVRITTVDASGNTVYDSGWVENQVTDYAASAIAKWLIGIGNTGYASVPSPQYTELGTGTGTPSAIDTNLFAPVTATNQRCATFDNPSANVAQWTSQYFGTVNNAGSYTEEGLFDQNGNLWAHLMEAVTITVGLSTTILWAFTVTV